MTTHAASSPLPRGHDAAADASATASRASGAAWARAKLAVTVAVLTGLTGLAVTIGADSRWAAALGARIAAGGSIPTGIPFAAAPTASWHNSLALAELLFHALEAALGDRGLALAQLACVAVALAVLGADAEAERRSRQSGAPGGWSVTLALLAVTIGAFPSLAIVRLQMFSLALFPVLLALLRAESRAPSRRIWLSLPLLALWSNLHGAVLSGVLVLATYLVLDRARHDRLTAVGVLLATPATLCLNAAGLHEFAYLHGLLTNLAAERGAGMWAPLGASPFDFPMILVAALLAIQAARRPRPRLWELVVAAILAGLTVKAGRDGVWLLFFLVAPATGAVQREAQSRQSRRQWNGFVPIGAVLALALVAGALARTPPRAGASGAAVATAIRLAAGHPILADSLPAEQVALAGGRIWAGDPLDAFSRATQGAYLDFIAGARTRAALALLGDPRITVVLATSGSPAAELAASDPAFTVADRDSSAVVFAREPKR